MGSKNALSPPECGVAAGDPSSSMSHSLRSPALAQNNRHSFVFYKERRGQWPLRPPAKWAMNITCGELEMTIYYLINHYYLLL